MLLRRMWPSRPGFENFFPDFDQLRRDMLRMLDSMDSGNVMTAGNELFPGIFPPVNVTQDDSNFYVRAELPGIKTSDLSISALHNRVSISGKREIPPENEKASYHRRERAEGEFSRTITFPGEITSDKVEARYIDGVLELRLPKAENTRPRQIAVSS